MQLRVKIWLWGNQIITQSWVVPSGGSVLLTPKEFNHYPELGESLWRLSAADHCQTPAAHCRGPHAAKPGYSPPPLALPFCSTSTACQQLPIGVRKMKRVPWIISESGEVIGCKNSHLRPIPAADCRGPHSAKPGYLLQPLAWPFCSTSLACQQLLIGVGKMKRMP